MPGDRRAWHRGGACLVIVNPLRRGRTTCPRETSVCRGPWGPPRTYGYVRTCGAIRFAIAPYVLRAGVPHPGRPGARQRARHHDPVHGSASAYVGRNSEAYCAEFVRRNSTYVG